ncbi:MAG: pyrroline-5-carboxylate reductase [Saprospiraceae bacterium]|nr:pyrroline-5-carboxylate reductase [Saprospiraceae bacterium]MBP9193032.1 pyrroline-5-carboxylate reductase [Saprospiraceae bacterium]
MKILIIGGGNMGQTFARSFLSTHIVGTEQMFILEKSPEKAKELEGQNLGTVYGEPGDYVQQSDLIILAVKPQDFPVLATAIRNYIDKQQVVLSIMAGVKMAAIHDHLGTAKVVRAMPNLPAQTGSGMTVFTSSAEVTRIELVTVQNLINATGKAIYVDDETKIDAATAISGSGPAYVFYFMQGLIEAAQQMGFNQAEAELLAYQTFKGAIDLFNKSDYSCESWIRKVMSKGGTTEAAFKQFEKQQTKEGFITGVNAALERAIELSKPS